MHLSLILLHLAGATMLLLFAVHMVRQGMENAFGETLRSVLGAAGGGRVFATVGGTVMAVMLQSSTAVAMIACGLAAGGMLTLTTGLALLLGADLGSALVTRILSFDLGWLVPVCLFVGGMLHLKLSGRTAQEVGRMLLGIGFVLLSLRMIATATGPLRDSAFLPSLAGYLSDDYLTAFLVGALFTWLIHSSVAAILMLAAFAGQGVLPLEAAVPLVLGANLGAGFIAFWLSRGMPVESQRIPIGNLIFRAGGAAVALMVVETMGLSIGRLGATPDAALVNFHLLFNFLLVLACLPLVSPMGNLARGILANAAAEPDEKHVMRQRISALDRSVVGTPRLALASATRELLRMGELVEAMTRPVMELLKAGTSEAIGAVRDLDEAINQAHTEIKLYLAEMNRGEMSAGEARRSAELTDIAINLEHAGDIVAKQLLALADERAEKAWRFSADGWDELISLHRQLLENMHLALNVLVSQDQSSARQLVVAKETMRQLYRQTHTQHLKRLQMGRSESIATSGMHLEVARGLKEMNSLLATVAYPILEASGDLLESRLAARSLVHS